MKDLAPYYLSLMVANLMSVVHVSITFVVHVSVTGEGEA